MGSVLLSCLGQEAEGSSNSVHQSLHFGQQLWRINKIHEHGAKVYLSLFEPNLNSSFSKHSPKRALTTKLNFFIQRVVRSFHAS